MSVDYLSAIGPGSDLLDRNELNGRTLVSRNGEITQNAFIDAGCWNLLQSRSSKRSNAYIPSNPLESNSGLDKNDPGNYGDANQPSSDLKNENLPPFYEWATTQVGFICVYRLNNNSYQNRLDAETAVPVISCAQLLMESDEKLFQFAGVARSSSVRDYDDQQNGMKKDDHFTLAVAGMVTLLNNSDDSINRGDLIEWTFLPNDKDFNSAKIHKKQRAGPRRIMVRKAKKSHRNVIGRAMSSARRGGSFDLLLQ